MLVIREEQIAALAGALRQRFEIRLRAHVTEVWPEACAEMGDAAVRASIRDGVDKAYRYGLATEHDIARFVALRYTLGPHFDADPGLPWVAEILNGPELASGAAGTADEGDARMDRLYERLQRELEATDATTSE